MRKSKWESKAWEPTQIIYEPTDEEMTASAGLSPLIDLFMESPQYAELGKCLPARFWPAFVALYKISKEVLHEDPVWMRPRHASLVPS